MMDRREFLAAAALGAACWPEMLDPPVSQPVNASRLPRWRGFNLTEMCVAEYRGAYREQDFELIRQWGFDFVRLPLSYLCWTDPAKWTEIKEERFAQLDRAVDHGAKYGIHVNLNLHRAPGYCVNPPKEPLDLWTDEKALDACATHWAYLAKRYKGIPNERLSFDLLNEPAAIPEERYVHVANRLVGAIRDEDQYRLIIADGLKWGRDPVKGLAGLGIAQSTRGYDPMQVSHYKASWVGGADKYPEPTWPLEVRPGNRWDKERLRKEKIEPWKALEREGVGVHVGEWGAFNRTPHAVVLSWMRDCLDLWKEAGWGWSLWNFRGGFGILDSGRKDITYESFKGLQLDREMLELLRAN